jgi:hypothetical protein
MNETSTQNIVKAIDKTVLLLKANPKLQLLPTLKKTAKEYDVPFDNRLLEFVVWFISLPEENLKDITTKN